MRLITADLPCYVSLFTGDCLYAKLIKPLEPLFQNNYTLACKESWQFLTELFSLILKMVAFVSVCIF